MPRNKGTTKHESLFRCLLVRGFASDRGSKSAHAAHGLGGEALAGQDLNVTPPIAVMSRKLSGARSIVARVLRDPPNHPIRRPDRSAQDKGAFMGTPMPFNAWKFA